MLNLVVRQVKLELLVLDKHVVLQLEHAETVVTQIKNFKIEQVGEDMILQGGDQVVRQVEHGQVGERLGGEEPVAGHARVDQAVVGQVQPA